ncbi:dipeptidyl peptidase 4 [Coniosporium apollinis CBS 100218]|uniref:dipeptidyl-peptidase IV n=1 Tax=Coniosporium apollinis (strain CBS 100218) TaxID=1168221 RepID=R7Z499_CONA1|nr:dipeptidyl peptidase 4 [Coniosporium apollinis CBS 100218]EON69005.1 dipeptidyl peptidase 4 [Coniosporium apollinis CBS 100218]
MRSFLALCFVALAQAIEPARQPHPPTGSKNGTLLTFNVTSGSSLSPSSRSLRWAATGERDGQFIYASNGSLVLEDVVTGRNEVFVSSSQLPEDYYTYWIAPDLTRVLFATNYTKQYRHSYFADYVILDRASGTLDPLVDNQVGDIQYAEWSPVNNEIAFVRGNDLYIRHNDSTITQITYDGGPDVFNGVPDWVYEEEIFGTNSALWFSPDGEYLAFLSFNETGVPTFTVPYFMGEPGHGQSIAPPYPYELDIRYPKVGATNPTVSFRLLDLVAMENSTIPIEAFPADDLIIGEVAWLTEEHSSVMYRAFNRVQDQDKHVVVNVQTESSKAVRERDVSGSGWLDNNMAITYLGSIPLNGTANASASATYYLDMSDTSGWNHLYLFPVSGGPAIPLTSGEWEVTAILKVDSARSLIYYASTEHHSTERHVYSVSYATFTKKALVDDTVSAYWTASFSASASYYVLSYRGPDVPYQEVYSINSTTPIRTLTSNAAVYARINSYNLPNITYFELTHPDGFTLNVMQRLPANFDASKKYPVLFTPYGGPGAQEVTKVFQALDWNAYIASDPELQYITYTVDNRGTGFKGRAFRAAVSRQLGLLETQDQIWAARTLAQQNAFIDAEKIGMWGWSYGGYLTSKVIEANSGVFSLGLITAPVSDWRLYDSMYTERYMGLPSTNSAGYNTSAVRSATGFKNVAGGTLVQHGTGDDNVHFQNSAALVDTLVGAGVSPEKMQVQWFTDSDHSIQYNGANEFLYKQLTKKLFEEKQRVPGERVVHQWSRRGVRREGRL